MVETDRSTITGTFTNRAQTQRAVDELRRLGFDDEQISLRSEKTTALDQRRTSNSESSTGTGIILGALVGALLGALVAAALVGLLPWFDAVIDADGLLATLIGAGAGAVLGGIVGASIGKGRRASTTNQAEWAGYEGRTIVTVQTANRADEARAALLQHNATDIQPAVDAVTDQRPSKIASGHAASMTLAEERLIPNKSVHQLGTVHVRKEVEETTGRLEVDAMREEVSVEHEPVGTVVQERVPPWEEDGVLVVPVYEEQLVVVKRLVMREKIRIHRLPTTERQLFEDRLLRDRLVVEDPDNTGMVRERYPTDGEVTQPFDVANGDDEVAR